MRFTIFKKQTFTELSDEELLLNISRGSKDGLREMYSRYGLYLFHYFNKMLQYDEELAKDFTQDFFIKLEKSAKLFQPQLKAKTWMFTIASNMCKNEWRSRNNQVQHLSVISVEKEYDHQLERNIDIKTANNKIDELLDLLSLEDRNILTLRYQQECSIKEIAEITSLPEGTIKSRIFYLLKKLRQQLTIQQYNEY